MYHKDYEFEMNKHEKILNEGAADSQILKTI